MNDGVLVKSDEWECLILRDFSSFLSIQLLVQHHTSLDYIYSHDALETLRSVRLGLRDVPLRSILYRPIFFPPGIKML